MNETEPFRVQLTHEWRIAAKNETIASASVYERFGHLWVYNIWTHHEYRKRGLATKIMEAILLKFGDETLYMGVDNFENRPMDNDQLAAWYVRFGFVMTEVPGVMIRRPE